jgi:hypothetical protein
MAIAAARSLLRIASTKSRSFASPTATRCAVSFKTFNSCSTTIAATLIFSFIALSNSRLYNSIEEMRTAMPLPIVSATIGIKILFWILMFILPM